MARTFNKMFYVTSIKLTFPCRYVTDMMNMLQGVYIFWAFVCTRRILNIVFGRERVDRMDRAGTKLYRYDSSALHMHTCIVCNFVITNISWQHNPKKGAATSQ